MKLLLCLLGKNGASKVFVFVSVKYMDGFCSLKKQREILAVGK